PHIGGFLGRLVQPGKRQKFDQRVVDRADDPQLVLAGMVGSTRHRALLPRHEMRSASLLTRDDGVQTFAAREPMLPSVAAVAKRLRGVSAQTPMTPNTDLLSGTPLRPCGPPPPEGEDLSPAALAVPARK